MRLKTFPAVGYLHLPARWAPLLPCSWASSSTLRIGYALHPCWECSSAAFGDALLACCGYVILVRLLSTCCAWCIAPPELPVPLRVLHVELDCWMLALNVAATCHPSCRRAPDTAHVVRPCLKGPSCRRPAHCSCLCPPRLLGVHPSFESTGCSWLGPSLRAFVRGPSWSVDTLDPVTRALIDPSACLMETCALSVPVRVQKQAHWRRSHRGRFKGCHQ